MDFSVKSGSPDKVRTPCVVVAVFQSRKLSAAARALDKATRGSISTIVRRGDIDGKPGSTLVLPITGKLASERVLLVGCGKQGQTTAAEFRRAMSAAASTLQRLEISQASVFLHEIDVKEHSISRKIRHAAEAAGWVLYRFDQLKSGKSQPARLRKLTFCVSQRSDLRAAQHGCAQGSAISAGVRLARELGNLPGNICTPSYLAEQAKSLQKSHGLKTTVLEQKDMEKLGMGALLSVAKGSRQPPKLIVMEHRGAKRADPPVVLVGKGLTFDAGGISLKPASAMDEMKFDMCGAASVFGTLSAVAELELPCNVVGIVPSSENLPDGAANKPGDVVTSMSGQTIEVLNTDAEGRLILCDALTYCKRYKPRTVIDIATLTGACVVALGKHASGLFSNDDALAQDLINAGEASLDRAWRLPLWDDYQTQLDTNFADIANIGGRDAGAITAACFLSRFTKEFDWAHLDIAGTAWNSGKQKGSTGRPVPLLTEYVLNRSGAINDLE